MLKLGKDVVVWLACVLLDADEFAEAVVDPGMTSVVTVVMKVLVPFYDNIPQLSTQRHITEIESVQVPRSLSALSWLSRLASQSSSNSRHSRSHSR